MIRPPRTGYRSVISDASCRHEHPLCREARECGYKRAKKDGTYENPIIIDHEGVVIEAERGYVLDEAHEDAAREARRAGRREEIAKLRREQRAIDEQQWYSPFRPRRV